MHHDRSPPPPGSGGVHAGEHAAQHRTDRVAWRRRTDRPWEPAASGAIPPTLCTAQGQARTAYPVHGQAPPLFAAPRLHMHASQPPHAAHGAGSAWTAWAARRQDALRQRVLATSQASPRAARGTHSDRWVGRRADAVARPARSAAMPVAGGLVLRRSAQAMCCRIAAMQVRPCAW